MRVTTTRNGVASERIASALRDSILRGEHPPGTRILQEDVASDFGASRLPVREAFRILEADGLITLVANTGAWVSRLSLAECEEIYQLRERIEPLLLGYSIPNLSEEQLNRLDELAATMQTLRDPEEFLRLDREFHLLSYAGASTAILGDTVRRLWNTTQHYRRAYTRLLDPDGNRIVHDEHHMLVAALRVRDADDAERVLYGHIRRTRLELARHPALFDA
ncbi:GntR family transcriptional regulator [Subtercola sp. Z020]|nr:GntR family transcriptional regulator [Subtercola sp. Z020]